MIIIGSGMAGLLAAGLLRGRPDKIVERQTSVPNNHSAVLRFRSSVVGDSLNIPFKKVSVLKAVAGNMNPVAAALSYSLKTNGTARLRSSISANGEMNERYIAPLDFIDQMWSRVQCKSEFGCPVDHNWLKEHIDKGPIISTIPMPALMDLLRWDDRPDFHSIPGYNITCTLTNVDAYCTLYIPDRIRVENRISLTGDKLTIEVALPRMTAAEVSRVVDTHTKHKSIIKDTIDYALETLGVCDDNVVANDIEVKQQLYSKIVPIDESIRRNFIIWASKSYGVYSLGRFATWRPGLLLDDVVNDVRVIESLIDGGSHYDHIKKGL